MAKLTKNGEMVRNGLLLNRSKILAKMAKMTEIAKFAKMARMVRMVRIRQIGCKE